MFTELNEKEARVIGCLIEKSIVTPDQYPMTLNALVNACNQKSSRNPVMSLSQGEVQHTIRALEEKHFARTEENFKSRTEKYSQRFSVRPGASRRRLFASAPGSTNARRTQGPQRKTAQFCGQFRRSRRSGQPDSPGR